MDFGAGNASCNPEEAAPPPLVEADLFLTSIAGVAIAPQESVTICVGINFYAN